ncbi:MAG: hypothetical protein AB7T06_36995 [Kofleriaceae bacterium]
MLTWLIKKRLDAFEKKYGYDTSYTRELLAIDSRAFWAFAKTQAMESYRRDVPAHVFYAVKLTGVIAEDCGPCTQLGVAMAMEHGVTPKVLASILRGDVGAMSDEVALGVKFARACIAHDVEADTYRDEIVRRWGKRALVSLAFGLTMARVYPTMKYALGFGKACSRVVVGDEHIVVRGVAA